MRLLFFVLLVLPLFSMAQPIDYDRVIPPDDAIDLSFEEKLIRLAWNNHPSSKILEHDVAISSQKIKQNTTGYLRPVSLRFNYGEQNINPNFNQGFFPIYNMGVTVNVGDMLANPFKVKEARENYKIAQLRVEEQKLFMRGEVIRRYQEYLQKIELLKLSTQNQEDSYTTYLALTQKFKTGEVSLDQYNSALIVYNRAQKEKVNAEGDVIIAKTYIEELIGIPIEEVE